MITSADSRTLEHLRPDSGSGHSSRLADANHITSTALAQLLDLDRRYRRGDDDPIGWTTRTITGLATLTAWPVTALAHALPALRPLVRESGAPTPVGLTSPCVACWHCTARKGIRSLVIQRAATHDHICLRHSRWLNGPEQHALNTLPEVCTANRRHRRLRRRHNGTTLEAALARARGLVHDWLEADDQPDFQQRCAQRLDELSYDPAADPYRPSQHRLELATYPEVISLAAYFISEH